MAWSDKEGARLGNELGRGGGLIGWWKYSVTEVISQNQQLSLKFSHCLQMGFRRPGGQVTIKRLKSFCRLKLPQFCLVSACSSGRTQTLFRPATRQMLRQGLPFFHIHLSDIRIISSTPLQKRVRGGDFTK